MVLELERLSVKDFRKTLTKSVLSQHPWYPKYGCKFRYLLCHSLKLLFHSNPQVVHLASQTPSKNHTLSRLVDEYKLFYKKLEKIYIYIHMMKKK